MTDPTSGPPGKHGAIARQDRLRRALRENLKRRKSQMRGRAGVAGDRSSNEGAPPDAGGMQEPLSGPADPDQG